MPVAHDSAPRFQIMAPLLLMAGVAALVVLLFAQAGGGPHWLTSRARQHAPLWCGAALTAIVLGGGLTWRREHPRTGWRPERPGPRFRALVVYTRQDCPLCDEALEVLAAYQPWLPAAVEVDVDEDSQLQRRYGELVPVVECDGRVRFLGRVNEMLLQRLIEGAPPMGPFKQR